ncbi:transcription factor, partial [Colletotrichum truncatum]
TQGTSFNCPYCEKAFARRDVCRKHAVHCPNKTDREAIPILRRGQKPRACDACFHSKQSCDTSEPCERCVARKLSCTYHRLEDTSQSATSSSSLATTAVGSPANNSNNHNNNDKDRTKITVAFLLGLTNPNSDNILEFLASEAAARTEGDGLDSGTKSTSATTQFPSGIPTDQDFAAFLPVNFYSGFGPDSVDFLYAIGGIMESATAATSASPFSPEAIEGRAAALLYELQELHNALKVCEPWYDGEFDLAIASSVFSAHSLCQFAATYFRVSHLDFPILHRPFFGTERTTKTLLLAVGVAGALRSPPSDDALAARGFLGLVEEYIFRTLHRQMPYGSTPEYTDELEESLQAALMIHSVQFFRNDTATRRKNRTLRLPTLVSAVRCLGLAQTRHKPVFEYEDFVRNETRIRLATWLALADWQQCGMSNAPPTMTPAEMTCDLPCPLELFDAKDADEYFEVAQTKGLDPSRRIVSVRHCVDALMSDSWKGMESFPFEDITATDLQILIFGINAMVASANLMGILSSSSHNILRAVSRWEDMWDTVRERMGPAKFEKSGMVRYNTELCWAAKVIVKIAIAGDRSSAYMQKVGHDSLVELHEFVRQYRDF